MLIDSSSFDSMELLLAAVENAQRDVIVFGPDIFLEEKLRAKFDIKVFVEMDSDLCLSNYLKTFKSCAENLEQHLNDYFSLIQPLNEKIRFSAKFANLRRPQASSNDKLIDLLVDEKSKTLNKYQISLPRDMFWKPASQQQPTDSNKMVDSVECSKSEFNWDQ
ncbi:uridine kinase [Legionella cherrii]|uniref:uridine kinase n=1 Tax=Legionella cherrii TaxID=28084 RepID=UPI001ED9879A|nr:uridine kinase [Legionella cherrii]